MCVRLGAAVWVARQRSVPPCRCRRLQTGRPTQDRDQSPSAQHPMSAPAPTTCCVLRRERSDGADGWDAWPSGDGPRRRPEARPSLIASALRGPISAAHCPDSAPQATLTTQHTDSSLSLSLSLLLSPSLSSISLNLRTRMRACLWWSSTCSNPGRRGRGGGAHPDLTWSRPRLMNRFQPSL